MEENSISIINRNNGSLTGEKAQALPIKLTGGLSWIQYVFIGIVVALLLSVLFIFTVQKQVVAVEVSGRANDFQIFEVN